MRINIQKVIVFILTFLAYASLHALREGWSYSKPQLQKQFQISKSYLGIIDAVYLLSYSIGMAILGSFLHKISIKAYVIGGLVMSILFFVLPSLIYSFFDNYSLVTLTLCMSLNGIFQATGWPGLMGIFGNWFKKNKKGLLFAIWAMNANIGNLIASNLCNFLQQQEISWVWNFWLISIIGLAVAGIMQLFLKQKPIIENMLNQQNVNNSQISNEQGIESNKNSNQSQQPQQQILKYGIFSVLCLPRAPLYAIGYSCLKGCIYGLLFWLPAFFQSKSQQLADQKGFISGMIDVGSLIGGLIIGYLADRYERRAIFLCPLLLLSSIIMFIVSFALTTSPLQYYIAMFLIGFCIGGPYNIIGTLITIDIGQNLKSKNSIAKVSSLIEGSAALFTALSMVIIPYIEYDFLFYLFSSECIIATLVLMPLFLQQLRLILNKNNKLNEQMIANNGFQTQKLLTQKI